jgi:RNA polymerase sigma-70 factor (ECF subfamily)
LLSQGNREAFDILFSRHWEALYKSAFFILKDEDASKDVVQDVFIWLWENRTRLNINSLKSYLHAAVKFKVANYIRSGKIRESFFGELAGAKILTEPAGPEETAELKELKSIIQAAIDELPDKCREIFLLSRDQQLSNAEIAAKLGLSIKTVENQMTIALRRIRNAVQPYLGILVLLFVGAGALAP